MDEFNKYFVEILTKKYLDCNGRARRKEFWMFGLFQILVFIVIGIIPLVPGFRVYRSMLFFVRGELDKGIAEGVHACFMAVAIAVGIILATSIVRMIRQAFTDYKRKKHRIE